MKILLCMFILVPAAHCFQKDEVETITRTLAFKEKTESQRVLIDNIDGSISVLGYDGTSVELKAVRRTRAESEGKFEEAKTDVVLDISEQRDRVEIIVETPWRNRWERRHEDGDRYYGYEVEFDFEVRVPRKTQLFLRTVNDGDIIVENVEGDFEIRNVNGDVEMKEVAGSGRVSTVNGHVDVSFRKNPNNDCLFQTVNGRIDVTFQGPLSADFLLKTFNGNAYTDFDVTAIPRQPGRILERRGKRIYRAGDDYVVRAGEGGPKLAFDTLNGNINIRKHE